MSVKAVGALLLYCLALVPAVALLHGYSPLTRAATAVGALLLLAALGTLWRFRTRSGDAANAGLVLGLLWVVEIGINNVVAPPVERRDAIDNAFWAAIALGIFVLAVRATLRSGRFRAAVASGLWSGSVSGVLACATALSVAVFGTGLLTHDPVNVAEWGARGHGSGAPNMTAYFACETFAGAFLHLTVLGPGMGALLGVLGGGFGAALRAVPKTHGTMEP